MRRRWLASTMACTLLLAAASVRADVENFADTAKIPHLVVRPGSTLVDVLADVQKSILNFKYILLNDPMVSANEPSLPAMDLSDITLNQFIALVNSTLPGVRIDEIDVTGEPDKPPLFKVDLARHGHASAPATRPALPEAHVRVFSLTALVEPRAAERTDAGDHRREATDDVLSAVQAALDVAALPGPPATLRIHQPTMTLIVRGSPEQLELIDQTLGTLVLSPKEREGAYATAYYELQRHVKQLEAAQEAAKAKAQTPPGVTPDHF